MSQNFLFYLYALKSCALQNGRNDLKAVGFFVRIHLFFLLRTSKILPRLNNLIFFNNLRLNNVRILFLTAIYCFMVENRLQRPSGVYVCPVLSSRTCVYARHVILMVLHVLYQVT